MGAIILENVDFSYGKKPVLKNFSLSIKGEGFTALLGANGAGKSTTFNLISGILMPDSGTVKIGGVDANDRKQRHTSKMGFVFQENTLDLELSVQQNIRYSGPKLWNDLNEITKTCSSISTFTRYIKNVYFEQYKQ